MTTIKFKKLTPTAQVPTRGSKYAAGYDLSADIGSNVIIAPHTTIKIGTGLAVELPENTFGAIYARSGIASKEGLRPANCTGVVDCDYRGEIIVALHNHGNAAQTVDNGERVAQFVITPVLTPAYVVADSLSDTARNQGGFGSTGK